MEILFTLSDKYSTIEVDGRKEVLTFKACQELLKSSVFGQFFKETESQGVYDYSSNTLNRYKKKLRVLLDQDIYNNIEIATSRYITKQNIPEGGSKTEDLLRLYMEYIFETEFKTSYPSWLINPVTGKQLELDGYNQILGIAFELDGPDHYDIVWIKNRYDLTWKEAADKLEYRRKVDQYKTDECNRRGIELIRIGLDESNPRNFQAIVEELYESHTGIKSYKKKIDYATAMRMISMRFLNLRIY